MSDYEPTDSESDYEENEKILLQNVRRGNRGKYDSADESEQEVFNVGPDEDDSDDDEDEMELADSDIEGQEDEDDLPNENAWGKKRRNYYSTDFIDPDYGELDEKNARRAELEEEEASRLYLKFSGAVDNDDFYFDATKKDPTEKVDNLVDKKMNTDTSKLNEREKRNFFKSENPEFIGIMDDFKYKMEIQKNFLEPVLNKYSLGQISKSSGLEFVQTFDRLISNYFVNITAYLLLKADKTKLNNHPIIKRLIQYRDLLQKLCEIFDEVMKEKIQNLIKEENVDMPKKTQEKKRKKHKEFENAELAESIVQKKKKKKPKEDKENEVIDRNLSEMESTVEESIDKIKDPSKKLEETDKLEKRAITYQIAKNKGLTPRRKKEQRNPRVKHRNKFRKAKIRRKGAVREVRNELKKYGGEISGIKSTVTKSIKIKS